MPQRMLVDIIVAAVGGLIYLCPTGKAERLGGWMFFAGTLAALMAQR